MTCFYISSILVLVAMSLFHEEPILRMGFMLIFVEMEFPHYDMMSEEDLYMLYRNIVRLWYLID